jgi:hypothetical protein
MSDSHPNPLRIGVLGAAGILRKKNWQAIQCSGNAVIAALATRDLKRTQEVIAERQAAVPFPEAPKAYANYEDLLADPLIEAVYLPLPTAVRKEWIIRAANAGKHIISEKPAAVNAAGLRDIFAACRANQVQFMDGVMFDHNPRLKRVLEMLDDPVRIGPVRRITSVFSFLGTGDFQERISGSAAALNPPDVWGIWAGIACAPHSGPCAGNGRSVPRVAFSPPCPTERPSTFPVSCASRTGFRPGSTVPSGHIVSNGSTSAVSTAPCACLIL